MINQISDFVAKIRIQTPGLNEGEVGNRIENDVGIEDGAVGGTDNGVKDDRAREVAGKMIIDAERFRAAVKKPPGTLNNVIFENNEVNSHDMNLMGQNEIINHPHQQMQVVAR